LNSREFGFANQPVRLGVQRSRHDNVITTREHLYAVIRAIDMIHKRVRILLRGDMPLDCENLHSDCPDSCSNRAADVAVTDNADGLARNGQDIKWFPYTGHL